MPLAACNSFRVPPAGGSIEYRRFIVIPAVNRWIDIKNIIGLYKA